MIFLWSREPTSPDIDHLYNEGKIEQLVCILGHTDRAVRVQASEMLGRAGAGVMPALAAAIHTQPVPVRLGAVEFMGSHALPGTTFLFTEILKQEKSPDVRLAAVSALGYAGTPKDVPLLVGLLRDKDRYIRYASSNALIRLGQVPDTSPDREFFLIAHQDWDTIKTQGPAVAKPLLEIFRDADPDTRMKIQSAIEGTADPHYLQICRLALRGADPRTRWKAVGTAMNCGISALRIPFLQAGHIRSGPDPATAALLNFLFLGIGYNYLGKWWGFPVFMAYLSVIVLAQLVTGPLIPYIVTYPVTGLLAVHTYLWAEQMADREV